MSDISRILELAREGDKTAASELLTLVYGELKQMAARQARNQPPGATLNTTALVHEAWLRLAPNNEMPAWNSRGHFFAAASEAMRRVLIEAARRRKAEKRGGDRQRIDIDSVEPSTASDKRLLDLDEALQRLENDKPEVAKLVKMRFYLGLKNDEAAEILGVSGRTAKYWWAYAKAWLHSEMNDEE